MSDQATSGLLGIDRFSTQPYYYTKYYVDGFRSLRDFNIKLEEGLNVFVGPNGSGKTNFIEFLDFLSMVFNRGAAGAVSHSGGISRVFSQETLRGKIPRLRAHISGLADLSDFINLQEEDRSLFRFDYKIDIRYSKFHSAIFIASEQIKLKSLFWRDLALNVDSTVGSILLVRKSSVDSEEPKWSVGSRLLTRGLRNPLRYRNRLRRIGLKGDTNEDLLEAPSLAPDESFLSPRVGLPAVDAVRQALSRGRSFNLVPSLAKSPDDIAKPAAIGIDGSGLSSTLYHMQQAKKKKGTPHSPIRQRRFKADAIDDVVAWTSVVLPELSDILSVADPHTGKYISYLIVQTEEGTLRVPLQSASDGTIKWLSFVCLIIGQGAVYSIEEPENFLHPAMQRYLIKLIRESLESEHPGSFIISTHSESIINQCSPDELLLFKFNGGRTSSKRLDDPHLVEEQINDTGFGLGYYYAANALS